MSQEPEEPTETTPCSGCGEDTPDDALTAVGADPQSDYRLCPTCVHKVDREAYLENMEGHFQVPMGTVVALPPCCVVDTLATPCERAYAAYNRAGDPATAGLNFRGDPCPTWDELPENIRVKWRAASDAVVMEVEETIRAAEVEVARMGALLQAHVDEVAALRGGILHFQAQLIAAQDWILNNHIGLQPVQIAFTPVSAAPAAEPEVPGILPKIFRLLDPVDAGLDTRTWADVRAWGRMLFDGDGKTTTSLADAQRIVQRVADGRYVFSTRVRGGEWDPPMWDPLTRESEGRLPITLEDLRATTHAACVDGRGVHPALEALARNAASSDGGSYGDYP